MLVELMAAQAAGDSPVQMAADIVRLNAVEEVDMEDADEGELSEGELLQAALSKASRTLDTVNQDRLVEQGFPPRTVRERTASDSSGGGDSGQPTRKRARLDDQSHEEEV